MRLSSTALGIVLAASLGACSNDAPTKAKPSGTATTAASAPSAATSNGGGKGNGSGKGGGKGRNKGPDASSEYKAVSAKRSDADWPKAGRYERTLEVGGKKRSYLVQIPPTYRDKKTPVLFMLHGKGGTPEKYARENLGISVMAAKNGWIAVFPQGAQKVPDGEGYAWSHGLCFDEERPRDDELGFFKALIEQLKKDVKVDDKRLYAMGFSSGGKMTQVLGAEMGDTFAAIVPIAGFSICQREGGKEERIEPKTAMNVLLMFGGKDPGLPVDGGPTDKSKGKLTVGSVKDMTEIWTKVAKCPDPVKKGKPRDSAITIDHKCKDTGKRVLTVIANRVEHAIPKKLGNRPAMSLVSRFLEGAYLKK